MPGQNATDSIFIDDTKGGTKSTYMMQTDSAEKQNYTPKAGRGGYRTVNGNGPTKKTK